MLERGFYEKETSHEQCYLKVSQNSCEDTITNKIILHFKGQYMMNGVSLFR